LNGRHRGVAEDERRNMKVQRRRAGRFFFSVVALGRTSRMSSGQLHRARAGAAGSAARSRRCPQPHHETRGQQRETAAAPPRLQPKGRAKDAPIVTRRSSSRLAVCVARAGTGAHASDPQSTKQLPSTEVRPGMCAAVARVIDADAAADTWPAPPHSYCRRTARPRCTCRPNARLFPLHTPECSRAVQKPSNTRSADHPSPQRPAPPPTARPTPRQRK